MAYDSCWTVSSAVLPSYIFYTYSAKSPYSLHGTKHLWGSKQMMCYWINSLHFMESWNRKKHFFIIHFSIIPTLMYCVCECVCAHTHTCARVFSDTFRITHHTASNDSIPDEWWFGKVLKRKSYEIIMILSQNLPEMDWGKQQKKQVFLHFCCKTINQFSLQSCHL